MNKNTKALVTGAPGWLGSRLAEVLREKERAVRCLVLPGLNDAHLRETDAEIFRGDLSDSESLKGVCAGVKTVFHCAGLIHPRRIRQMYEVNVAGTKNILEEAIGAGVDRFIYVSSNSAGGINTSRDRLMRESDAPRPYRHYGLSKHKAEEIVLEAFKKGRIRASIVRPCWFYGIRQPKRQTTFFKMIKKGNPVVFGDGNCLRSMSYIDNVIDALFLVEEKDVSSGKVYWIADERPYPVIEIYRTIAELLGVKEFRPRFIPAFVSGACEAADGLLQAAGLYVKEVHVAGEMNRDIACSIKKAREELGYEPRVDLKEGMRQSIEWCRAQGLEL